MDEITQELARSYHRIDSSIERALVFLDPTSKDYAEIKGWSDSIKLKQEALQLLYPNNP